MARRRKIQAPQIDPTFEAIIRTAFAELCDLDPTAPIEVEAYHDLRMADVRGTLWDGRSVSETYRQEDGEIFVIKGIGCRYRVVSGEFWNGGRKRSYAAYLVR